MQVPEIFFGILNFVTKHGPSLDAERSCPSILKRLTLASGKHRARLSATVRVCRLFAGSSEAGRWNGTCHGDRAPLLLYALISIRRSWLSSFDLSDAYPPQRSNPSGSTVKRYRFVVVRAVTSGSDKLPGDLQPCAPLDPVLSARSRRSLSSAVLVEDCTCTDPVVLATTSC